MVKAGHILQIIFDYYPPFRHSTYDYKRANFYGTWADPSWIKEKRQNKIIADKVIKEGLNVRQLEQFVQQLNENVSRETKKMRKKKCISCTA